MRFGIVLVGLSFGLFPGASLHAQGMPTGTVGWYNGDWMSGIPGVLNAYVSSTSFYRVYDDFVVPDSGWLVTGVFAHSRLSSTAVTQASWEIRSGVSAGNGGMIVASGTGAAKVTVTMTASDGSTTCLIEVDGLSVALPAGKYWLSVAPVTAASGAYLCLTLGAGAIGDPPGNDGAAYFYVAGGGAFFTPIQETGGGGTSGDFSMGVLAVRALTPPAPLPAPVAPWPANLASLVQQMDALEKPPFPGASLADFNAGAAALSSASATLSDAEIRTRLEALVSSLAVSHTDVGWPYSTFNYLPLTFYWFDDGLYVTAAAAQYRELLGGRLLAVGTTETSEVTHLLTALVPTENDQWPKYVIPWNRLTNTDFLFGTGITDTTLSAQIRVAPRGTRRGEAGRLQPPSPSPVSVTVEAVPQSQFPPMVQAFQGNPPLYRQHPEKNYWATAIDGGATVYFQYNSCTEDPAQASSDFLAQLNLMLADPGVQRVIVDMRHNVGGFVTILDPWIAWIKTSRFNQIGRLYVIVGKATFSAAMEASDHFRDQTAAIFVGEPTGGKPQFVVRVSDFGLPNFGIRVSYSGGSESARDPSPTLEPDIPTGLTFADYMAGRDPALAAILSLPLPASR